MKKQQRLWYFQKMTPKRTHIEPRYHVKPAGVLIGFTSEDDWFDYRLENDPRFLARIASARESLRADRGMRIEDLKE